MHKQEGTQVDAMNSIFWGNQVLRRTKYNKIDECTIFDRVGTGKRGVWAAAKDQLIVAYFCGDPPYFLPRSKFMHSSPPRLSFNKTSAHRVADDVVSGFDAPDREKERCGW
jgi:hypothetical protein